MTDISLVSEQALLDKLEAWMAGRDEPPSLQEVFETQDGELLAALLLKGFRAAAREAMVDRIDRTAAGHVGEEEPAANPVMRVFAGLVMAWSLSGPEQVKLLGIDNLEALARLKVVPADEVPTGVVQRLATLLDIFEAINTLLPIPERADRWVRSANRASGFDGRFPLEVMQDGPEHMRRVRQYLQAQILAA